MARGNDDHQDIEKDAQKKWASLELYQADLRDATKEPYYLLTEFPYPSGDLHIGHWYAFAVTDIFARLKRMQGYSVLFPIGFDAFGLPAENAAIKNKLDPKVWTEKNMERMRAQLRSMGASFDWSREVVTCDPSYYKWTQWLFLKLMEQGLAYRAKAAVKWCPKDQTVLANEQVVDGCCERCQTPVEERQLTQWFFKITDYAERLLKDLEPLPWREEIKEAQRAWIGKSEGARLTFALKDRSEKIEVFTTRPDTLFGVTYVVLAPEHPLVTELLTTIANKKAVEQYIAETKKKTERERSENKEKTGVKLEGVAAINPATAEEVPVYVAEYVLGSYGTGAVMAVPAHDERDFAFAKKHKLPMRQVIVPCQDDAINPPREGLVEVKRDTVIVHLKNNATGKYAILNWHGPLEGICTAIMGGVEAGQTPEEAALAEIKEEAGLTGVQITHRLSWVTAAKYCAAHKNENRCAHTYAFLAEIKDLSSEKPVSEKEKKIHTLEWVQEGDVLSRLTPAHQKQVWELLHNETALTGDGYLINSGSFDGQDNREASEKIVAAVGGSRATNYRLRDWLVSRQRYWGCPIPVVYDPEGTPHPVPADHLPWLLPTDVDFTPSGEAPLASSRELKERVEKIFGAGWTPEYDTLDTFVDSSWYYTRYLDPHNEHDFSDQSLMKTWLPVNRYSGGSEHTTMHLLYARFFYKALADLALVPSNEPFNERFNRGLIMGPDGQKMSKSKGNVINPDEFVGKYGADAVRIFLAFIGPYNEPGNYPWSLEGVAAMRKFLERVGRMVEGATEEGTRIPIGATAEKVRIDSERFKFNTAIAALMTLLNTCEVTDTVSKTTAKEYVVLMAPFAPHLAEHLWERLGGEGSVHQALWPQVEAETGASEVELVVQVNGKKRGTLTLSKDVGESEAVVLARAIPAVEMALSGGEPRKVVYVPGRVLNMVV